jgi:protein SDA1
MSGHIRDLAQLQNLVKRDPSAYYDEFALQWRRFQSELELFKLSPSTSSTAEEFSGLIMFLSHV